MIYDAWTFYCVTCRKNYKHWRKEFEGDSVLRKNVFTEPTWCECGRVIEYMKGIPSDAQECPDNCLMVFDEALQVQMWKGRIAE